MSKKSASNVWATDYILGDSIITPSNNIVHFGDDDFLVEAVYDDEELRPLVPQADEMLGDILATWRSHEDACQFGEDVPEWDDPDGRVASEYAAIVRPLLIDAGCILAEGDRYEDIIYFTGRAGVLKRSFDFCVAAAHHAAAVFKVSGERKESAADAIQLAE